MADIDKILEAEKTITTISGELSKMKSAVELLDSTKTKADAIIQTGEIVVENINSFVEQGSALVEKIGEFEIQGEIEKVNKQLTSVNKDLSDKTKTMGKNIEDVKDTKVRVAWQNESITLMPGDSIVVKETPGTVNISGQVYNPGLIEFRKGKKLKYVKVTKMKK